MFFYFWKKRKKDNSDWDLIEHDSHTEAVVVLYSYNT